MANFKIRQFTCMPMVASLQIAKLKLQQYTSREPLNFNARHSYLPYGIYVPHAVLTEQAKAISSSDQHVTSPILPKK